MVTIDIGRLPSGNINDNVDTFNVDHVDLYYN